MPIQLECQNAALRKNGSNHSDTNNINSKLDQTDLSDFGGVVAIGVGGGFGVLGSFTLGYYAWKYIIADKPGPDNPNDDPEMAGLVHRDDDKPAPRPSPLPAPMPKPLPNLPPDPLP